MGCSPVPGRMFGRISLLYPQDTSRHCFPPPSCDNQNRLAKYLLRAVGRGGKRRGMSLLENY